MSAHAELKPIEPPIEPPPRWTDLPLPPYRHVPGLTPHPLRSPEGHSPGGFEVDLGDRIAQFAHSWTACPAYLYGVDLFNQSYYWESHEAWEEIWNAVGHRSIVGRMLQGMIQVSAALLRFHVGSESGADRNFRKACRNFDVVEAARDSREPGWSCYLGVPLRRWRGELTAFLDSGAIDQPFLILESIGTRDS